KYGGKKVMAGAAALWSLATILTPWAASRSTLMLLAVRALFVLAEGVAFPTMSTFLPKWFPTHERATVVAISMGGFHLGNVISFLATPIIMSHIGLSGTFTFFASLGYLWLSVWMVNSELQLILDGRIGSKVQGSKFPSVRELFSKTQFLAVTLANVVNNWGYFVLLSWMPVYFKTVYNVNMKQAAWFSTMRKCAFGPILSILVIECKHKCLNVKMCPWLNKVQITSKGMFLSLSTLVLCTNILLLQFFPRYRRVGTLHYRVTNKIFTVITELPTPPS
ncbi:hypothetical protein ACJX0J_023074, partial [Zea mays]